VTPKMTVRLIVLGFTLILSGWSVTLTLSQESPPTASWQLLGDTLNSYKDPTFMFVDASPHGFAPSIAPASGTIYVAYAEFNSKGTTEVRIKRWNGENWTRKYTVLNKDGTLNAYDPVIAALGDVPYVAWTEKNDDGIPMLFVTRRSENGWLRTGNPLNVHPGFRATSPVLLGTGDELFLIWTEGAENTPQHLYLRRLAGDHWEDAGDPMNRDPERDAYEPSFAHDGGAGYLAWSEPDADKIMRIHVRRVETNGEPLVGKAIHASSGAHAVSPSVAVYKGIPYVAWVESSATRTTQIALAVLKDGIWTRDANVANNNPASHALSPILISGTDSHFLAWTETAADGTPRLHLKKFGDGTWSSAAPILPMEFQHMASTPALALDGSGLLAAWKQDNEMGVFKIRVARLMGSP
jgi:hypothetical protein